MIHAGDAGAARAAALHDEHVQAACYVALLAVVTALSSAGAGSVARLLYMAVALGWAYVTHRRSPWLFVTGTLWFWIGTSFVRRVIEWRSGFQNADLVLLTPNLMALLILPDVLCSPGVLRRPHIGYPLLLSLCVLCGLCVSLMQGQILAAAASATDWVTPLLYLFHFVCSAHKGGDMEAHFEAFLPVSLILVVPYAVCQWYLMPPWDAQWMIGSGMVVVGQPVPMGSRVFGSFNNPLFLSLWCAVCLVLTSYFRSLLGLVMAPFALFVVAFAEVRCEYGALVVALTVGAFAGRGGFGRLALLIGVSLVTIGLSVSLVGPQIIDQISSRFDTLGDLSNDGSAEVRVQMLHDAPMLIEAAPFGLGIGAQGRGAGAGSNDPSLALNVDNGLLSVYLALGWIPGTLYILGLGAALLRGLRIARRVDSASGSAMAAASLCALATFPFLNVLGFSGVVMWCCLGFALAQDGAVAAADVPARGALELVEMMT